MAQIENKTLINFPCDFAIKVMGEAKENFSVLALPQVSLGNL